MSSALSRSVLLGLVAIGASAAPASAADLAVQIRHSDGEARTALAMVCVGQGCAAAGTPAFKVGDDGMARYVGAEGDVVEVYDPFDRGAAQRLTATAAGVPVVTLPNLLTPGPHPAESTEERAFLALVNAARTSAGLPTVEPLTRAYDVADRHNAWMLRTATQSHTGEFGTSPSDRAAEGGIRPASAAEIVFLRGGTAQAAFDGFMASPGHHAIIMTPEMRYVGMGADQGSWVGMFLRESTCAITCGAPAFDPAKPSYVPPAPRPPVAAPVPTIPGTASDLAGGSTGTSAGSSRRPAACTVGFARAPKARRLSRSRVRVAFALTACTPKRARVTATAGRTVAKAKSASRVVVATRASRIVLRVAVGGRTRATATVKVARR